MEKSRGGSWSCKVGFDQTFTTIDYHRSYSGNRPIMKYYSSFLYSGLLQGWTCFWPWNVLFMYRPNLLPHPLTLITKATPVLVAHQIGFSLHHLQHMTHVQICQVIMNQGHHKEQSHNFSFERFGLVVCLRFKLICVLLRGIRNWILKLAVIFCTENLVCFKAVRGLE